MADKTINLGRIGFVIKGEYSATSTYKTLDVVTNDGDVYAAISAVPAGTVLTDTSKWQKLIDSSSKVDTQWSTEDAGKALVIGEDGTVTTGTVSSYAVFG